MATLTNSQLLQIPRNQLSKEDLKRIFKLQTQQICAQQSALQMYMINQNNNLLFKLKHGECLEGDFSTHLYKSMVKNGQYAPEFDPSHVTMSDITVKSTVECIGDTIIYNGTLNRPVNVIANKQTYMYTAGIPVEIEIFNASSPEPKYSVTIMACNPTKYNPKMPRTSWWGGRKTRKANNKKPRNKKSRHRKHR